MFKPTLVWSTEHGDNSKRLNCFPDLRANDTKTANANHVNAVRQIGRQWISLRPVPGPSAFRRSCVLFKHALSHITSSSFGLSRLDYRVQCGFNMAPPCHSLPRWPRHSPQYERADDERPGAGGDLCKVTDSTCDGKNEAGPPRFTVRKSSEKYLHCLFMYPK